MIIKTFTPEWKLWIWSNIVNGFDKDSIFNILLNNGFEYSLIRSELGVEPTNSLVWRRQYSQESLNNPYEVQIYPYNKSLCDNPMSYRIESNRLEIYHFPELLTYDECDELTTLTDSYFSSNKKKQKGLTFTLDPSLEITKVINKRLSSVVGLSEDFGEEIFIQKFEPNTQSVENFDYILPSQKDYLFETKGQRVWSMQIWLNSLDEEGHLTFNSIERSIKPVKGEATIWKNIFHDENVNENAKYIHNPFVDGTKYVLFKYFRERGDISVEIVENNSSTEIELDVTEVK